MLQPGLGPDLPLEALDPERRAERRVQHLERDPSAVPEVLGEIHRGAGAAAQLLLEQVAVGQLGREPIVRVGQGSTMCHGRCRNVRPGISGDQCRTVLIPA